MPPVKSCEEVRWSQGVLGLLIIMVLLTVMVVNIFTSPRPAPHRPNRRRDHSQTAPGPPLPQYGETLVGWFNKVVIVDLLTYGTKQTSVWGIKMTRYPVRVSYVVRLATAPMTPAFTALQVRHVT